MTQANSIYVGDAIKFLSSLSDDCADLIIADPPYSLNKDKEFGDGAFFESREAWFDWCKRWLNGPSFISELKPACAGRL
ncbi:MAG: hypothetical protein ACYDDI_04155 [Candidatus Acidiferrales bacterium]